MAEIQNHMMRSEILRTRDGKKLALTIYQPAKENNSLLVIGGSVHTTQEQYRDLARYLVDLHYTVITFDYRGMGSSIGAGIRNNPARLHQWARQDLDAVLLFAKNNHPEKELIFLAHGVSGELTGLAAASQFINRIVLINSSLTCAALWPMRGRIRKAIIKLFIPLLNTLFGYFPAIRWLSLPRLPRGVMSEWAHWCNHRNGVFAVYPDNNYRKLQVPILSLSFSDDPNAPPAAVTALHDHFSNAAITWYHLAPADQGLSRIGHSGFFFKRPDDGLWMKLLGWLDEPGNGKTSMTIS